MLELNDENFQEEVMEVEGPVLVYFWAEWCAPCRASGPVLEELAKEHGEKIKFGKLNVDESSKTAQKYGIMSIPTVVVFKKDKETKREIGFPGKEGYEKLLKEVLNS